jgi:hypothetical protein
LALETRERQIRKGLEITRGDLIVQGFHRSAELVVEVGV